MNLLLIRHVILLVLSIALLYSLVVEADHPDISTPPLCTIKAEPFGSSPERELRLQVREDELNLAALRTNIKVQKIQKCQLSKLLRNATCSLEHCYRDSSEKSTALSAFEQDVRIFQEREALMLAKLDSLHSELAATQSHLQDTEKELQDIKEHAFKQQSELKHQLCAAQDQIKRALCENKSQIKTALDRYETQSKDEMDEKQRHFHAVMQDRETFWRDQLQRKEDELNTILESQSTLMSDYKKRSSQSTRPALAESEPAEQDSHPHFKTLVIEGSSNPDEPPHLVLLDKDQTPPPGKKIQLVLGNNNNQS